MPKETTFKDFVEMDYKKPYDQISEKEIKETYREIFCFGLAKDDLQMIGLEKYHLKI